MSIVPVYGHAALRARLLATIARGALPASLLLHGPRGVGKQRLARWLGQTLLCTGAAERRVDGGPCGACQHCRYAEQLAHPDLGWYFPRPRLKDGDASPEEIRADLAEVCAERAKRHGLYAMSGGMEGLFVATVRALVQQAALAPAMARRKVFVVGDADRLAPQEGSEFGANAFLKLLEEPPADTTLVLTSSEPGALLPTIRSRVVAVRVAPLPAGEMAAFAADPRVRETLAADGVTGDVDALVQAAGGAPGALFDSSERAAAAREAARLLDAALGGDRATMLRAAASQGVSKARGAFSDVLDALVVRLHALARDSIAVDARRPDSARALAATRAVDAVEQAKQRAAGNVSPQLVTAALLRELGDAFRRAG